ncbi:MAG: ParA family protein [Proteobacteria bacterium]|nr:ParA family protein [Pseudomonadota bacterium]
MKVIVPANNKGGVGKTKLSIILAEYFSTYLRKRVLAIDFDPQCNFSSRFLHMEIDPASIAGKLPPIHPDYSTTDQNTSWLEGGRSSIADIFYGQPIIPYPTHIGTLDIAPAHAEKLLVAEAVRRSEVVEKVYRQIGILLESQDVTESYDIVIIDTAPSKGPLTISAIKAATHMIIPSVMEEQPIQGVYGMMQLWMQESLNRPKGKPLDLIGILPNMFRKTRLHTDMLDSLKRNPEMANFVIPLTLGQRTAYAEVDAEGAAPKTVFDLPEADQARKETLAVCEYISERIFTNE